MQLLGYFLEHNRYANIVGIVAIVGVAYLFSKNRKKVQLSFIAKALCIQLITAFLALKTSGGRFVLEQVSGAVARVYQFADEGSQFIFGNLSNSNSSWGFIFAVKVLPIIIFFGAFMALLFYLGIIQRVVGVVSFVFRPLLGTSGAETLCAISNSFLGQTEAPLLIRHYLKRMTKSEMFVVMVSGMATISGAILAVFAAMGVPAKHLLTASVMAIPASLLIAKILYPEDGEPETLEGAQIEVVSEAGNVIDAIAGGTSDGLQLALNVGAMLISFLALIALCNFCLSSVSDIVRMVIPSFPLVNLNVMFGWLFAPFSYLLGFTGDEARYVAQLLGTKVTINELIAYSTMLSMPLSERTVSVVTYALCGFSNFSCIGIQIGGIGALVPEKRAWLSELGLYAVLGSSLANLLSSMMAALLL